MIISQDKGENFDINEYIKEYSLENHDKVKAMKKVFMLNSQVKLSVD